VATSTVLGEVPACLPFGWPFGCRMEAVRTRMDDSPAAGWMLKVSREAGWRRRPQPLLTFLSCRRRGGVRGGVDRRDQEGGADWAEEGDLEGRRLRFGVHTAQLAWHGSRQPHPICSRDRTGCTEFTGSTGQSQAVDEEDQHSASSIQHQHQHQHQHERGTNSGRGWLVGRRQAVLNQFPCMPVYGISQQGHPQEEHSQWGT
jgi:hypothetical protein